MNRRQKEMEELRVRIAVLERQIKQIKCPHPEIKFETLYSGPFHQLAYSETEHRWYQKICTQCGDIVEQTDDEGVYARWRREEAEKSVARWRDLERNSQAKESPHG